MDHRPNGFRLHVVCLIHCVLKETTNGWFWTGRLGGVWGPALAAATQPDPSQSMTLDTPTRRDEAARRPEACGGGMMCPLVGAQPA